MAFKYPLTIKAAQRDQTSQWSLGDALLRECGAPDSRGADLKLREAMAELHANGMPYKLERLTEYHRISHVFPETARGPGISHRTHIECGTPKMLKRVLTAWRHEHGRDAILPLHDCARLMKTIRAEDDRVRENGERKAHERALQAERAARARLTAARQRASSAAGGSARTAANAQITLAQRAVERAQERVADTAELPPHQPRNAPVRERSSSLVFIMNVQSRFSKGGATIDELLDLIGEADEHMLTNDTLAAFSGDAVILHEKAAKLREVLDAITGGRRPHLTVVAG